MRGQFLRYAIISFLGMVCFSYAMTSFVPAYAKEAEDDDAYYSEPYSEDLVLAVYADRTKLSPGIFAVQQNGRIYLPIGTLSDLLDFKIEFDRDNRYVEGWTTSEDNTYSIDASAGRLSYRGQVVDLPPGSVLNEDFADDDIYVWMEIYNQIWPLSFEVNYSSLVLNIIPDELLPFQQMLERKARQKKLLDRQAKRAAENINPDDFPFVAMPYQLFSKPTLDLDGSAGFDGKTDSAEYRFTVNGVQDLAYASADYSATLAQKNGKLDKPDNIRLRFRRQNIHEGALPFGLEDTQWGDVNLRNRDLIATGRQGRGLIFTTRENKFSNEFDMITVDGTGSPGWEAELYINDELINFGVVDERGEYRFEDVTIGYGNNEVRVVLYGPQGQIKERVENYFFQSNMVKAGQNEFSGGIVDSERDLIPVDQRDTSRPKGLAANIYGARGISDELTVFASANTIKDRDGKEENSKQYVTAGAIASMGKTLAQAEAYQQVGGGQALDVRTLSDFKGVKINTKTAVYRNFDSPDADDGNNAKKIEFQFDIKKIFATSIGALGLEARSNYLKRQEGKAVKTLALRKSLALKGTRITDQTNITWRDANKATATGRLSSTTRKNKWLWRNGLNYSLYSPSDNQSTVKTHFTDFQTELRYGKLREFSTALRFGRNFDSKETIAGVQITKDFDKFLGSLDVDWSSKFGPSLMLRASTSLGPYASDGSYLMQSDPLRNVGPISSFVFLDNDYDGVYSDGDEPVPDTKITMGRRITKNETDETGYLNDITPSVGNVLAVQVAKSSIDDPYVIPSPDTPGYSIYPRPGVMHRLDFPLIETGAIDGTLRWSGSGEPIAGLKLQLMKNDAEIIQSTVTAPDGYFTFEHIPPGNYVIRADPETGINIPYKYVDLVPGDLFQFGMDIDAVDLSQPVETDLDIGVGEDNLLSVKNILSIAKGFKDKKHKSSQVQPMTEDVVRGVAAGGVQKISAKSAGGPATVTAVRIGEHPDKIRIVLDLTGQTTYSLSYDPKSNSVFLELPFVNWSAQTEWQSKSGGALYNYRVEALDSGVRMILGVQDGVEIGASGLLKAEGAKKDRLYIDIDKK